MANILTCYYRPKPGGLCRRLFRAMRAVLERGHTVHYLAIEPFPIDHPNCIFHRFPWPRRYGDTLLFWSFFFLLSPFCLLFIAVANRVTHAFAFGTAYSFCMQPLRWVKGIGLTCFLRGDAVVNHKLRQHPAWIAGVEKIVEGIGLKGVHLVGVAVHLIASVRSRHPRMTPGKCSVLPNDISDDSTTGEREHHAPLHLAMVGVIEPRKNNIFALEILQKLKGRQWHLRIYGEGPDVDKLVACAKESGLCDRISFMGWQDPANIWPHIDLLIFPSLHEGMPNAVLEAIASHVAVIASDIQAHRDILSPKQLFSLADPEAWQRVLEKVIDAPGSMLKQMRHQQAQCAARLAFDWEEEVVRLIVSDDANGSVS